MSSLRDYSSRPPKKRPLPVVPEYEDEVNENEEPQDLSLKTRVRFQDSMPTKSNPDGAPVISQPKLHLMCKMPPIRIPSEPLVMDKAYQKDASKKYNMLGNEGLRLISEVASRVKELHYPPQVKSEPQITPASRERLALRERGTWSYHPYLPLRVYGLPSPAFSWSPHSIASLKRVPCLDSHRPERSGSTSPAEGSTEASSGSEGSPELREDKLTCPDCGRAYATVAGLSRHQQFHCLKEANRKFECKTCPKTYTSIGALKMHIRTHTLPCKCNVCGKAFSRPWLLQGHIRTHTGEKPFECHQCHRSFADRSNLRAHLQTHVDVKKYSCASCPKTFSRMSLLLKHQDHGCPGETRAPRLFSLSTSGLAPSPL